MNKPGTAYMNWSGGKDSSLCLHRVLQERRHTVNFLLTSVNAAHNRISMHGVRRELLVAQAAATGIPLETIELPEQPGMQEYEDAMSDKVRLLKNKGCTQAIFGDIFLEDLKKYREEKLAALGIECLFPLWKIPSIDLMREFIGLGFKAVIVCINEKYLDSSFCGREIDETFLADLPADVDPCGENGEYHSFVFDAPVFKYPIPFQKGGIVHRQYAAPGNAANNDDGLQANSPIISAMNAPSTMGFYFADLLPIT